MTIESAIADLTAATTDLLGEVQTNQAAMDAAVAEAAASAETATEAAEGNEFLNALYFGAL